MELISNLNNSTNFDLCCECEFIRIINANFKVCVSKIVKPALVDKDILTFYSTIPKL